jgi:hypothetical protein
MVNSKKLLLILALVLSACSENQKKSDTYKKIIDPQNLPNSRKVDFANFGVGNWNKVCFFEPYTARGKSTIALGFDWEVTEKTDIGSNEGINVIVFATDSEATEYLEIPRNKIDSFALLPTPCIPRNNAVFTYEDTSYIYRKN